jgi:sulfur-oxidizing protein SoxB
LQKLVTRLRDTEGVDAVLLLSHNGMDADLKLASRVSGIDAILGGHTHDAVPRPTIVANAGGKTLVTNAGSSGKFVAVLDLDVGRKHVNDVRYSLLPVHAGLIAPDGAMQALIDRLRAPYAAAFGEKLAVAGELLYRRGNFAGPVDQVICDALRRELDAQIALSPGFRFGATVLAGEPITGEELLSEAAISYPEVYVREMTGNQLKAALEDVADNLFNPDPYYQQGGDMVRVGGMDYACAPAAAAGSRISDMTLSDGTPLEAGTRYRVAGWASLEPQTGKPVSEVVAGYLRAEKTVRIARRNRVVLKGVAGNPGIVE